MSFRSTSWLHRRFILHVKVLFHVQIKMSPFSFPLHPNKFDDIILFNEPISPPLRRYQLLCSINTSLIGQRASNQYLPYYTGTPISAILYWYTYTYHTILVNLYLHTILYWYTYTCHTIPYWFTYTCCKKIF